MKKLVDRFYKEILGAFVVLFIVNTIAAVNDMISNFIMVGVADEYLGLALADLLFLGGISALLFFVIKELMTNHYITKKAWLFGLIAAGILILLLFSVRCTRLGQTFDGFSYNIKYASGEVKSILIRNLINSIISFVFFLVNMSVLVITGVGCIINRDKLKDI